MLASLQLADVYGGAGGGSAASSARYAALVRRYEDEFGAGEPQWIVRAPGRVNLIGEHVDYSDYGVLPMAIQADVVIAVGERPAAGAAAQLMLSNVDGAQYAPLTRPRGDMHIDAGVHAWTNYVIAGLRAVLDASSGGDDCGAGDADDSEASASAARHARAHTHDLMLMVHGTVPAGSGLSSSSALVCASACAASAVAGNRTSPARLAEACRLSERHVGVEGGGMDQAVSMLGVRDRALWIQFNPLSASPVDLPAGHSFVVAHTGVAANKYIGASANYNMRVVECRLAAALLARWLALDGDAPRRDGGLRTLRSVQRDAGRTLAEMAGLCCRDEVLAAGPYTRASVAAALGMTVGDVEARFMRTSAGVPIDAPDAFMLRKRAQHVFEESARVEAFAACREPARLGELMNESHASCRDLFEVSCPELDALTSLARTHGALGSRLTGAGWGGATVSLVPDAHVDGFLSALRREYYGDRPVTSDALFASSACAGACIVVVVPSRT